LKNRKLRCEKRHSMLGQECGEMERAKDLVECCKVELNVQSVHDSWVQMGVWNILAEDQWHNI
jgi:hypothetical protein